MNWLSGSFTYLVIWWTVLFAVLPFGNAHPTRNDPGEMPGAPLVANMKRKFLITSLIAATVWLAVFAVVKSDLISFQDMVRDQPD